MPTICEGLHALHTFPGAVRAALCWDVTQGRVESGRLSRRSKEKRRGLCLSPGPIPASTARRATVRGPGEWQARPRLGRH